MVNKNLKLPAVKKYFCNSSKFYLKETVRLNATTVMSGLLTWW